MLRFALAGAEKNRAFLKLSAMLVQTRAGRWIATPGSMRQCKRQTVIIFMEIAEFQNIAELVHAHASDEPDRVALVEGDRRLDYGALDRVMDRIGAALQRDGFQDGDVIAICAAMSIEYACVFLGALRVGVVVTPLSPGSTPQSLSSMLLDSQAKLLFADETCAFDGAGSHGLARVSLGRDGPGRQLDDWMGVGQAPVHVDVKPDAPFNIIYSSGTTGEPKGIVQSHRMRWGQVRRAVNWGYGCDTVALLSTPLYSNTTLVVFFPVMAYGGTAVLMPKFEARKFLELAQSHRVSHAMLVPVQYQRLMDWADFGAFDLTGFRVKFSTSAPFSAALKADVLARWPGGLIELYGMTEGGGSCVLEAHKHPEKLHTVGRPIDGSDMRLIDDQGAEVPIGGVGEVVGNSVAMMTGYHRQPEKTREVEWYDQTGKRFIRTGDIGKFDGDGFLTLLDRKKDMIISGGFNVYPSDLEVVLMGHAAVAEVAVAGVPSAQWGETPVAFVVCRPDAVIKAEQLLQWVNNRVSKTQRLAKLVFMAELPRSPIGKVLKRELRAGYCKFPTYP
jgi:acyl-CoA synthetase (AMP-forming)/AMP-acid ligase II